MDVHDRIKRDPKPLEGLMKSIPGFAGYSEREQRRGADRLLREFLADEIGAIIKRMERIASRWSKVGALDHIADLEQTSGRLNRAADKLRFADYGYSGLFDLVKIGEEDLHRFYEYDLSLRGFIADISDDVGTLADAEDDEVEEAIADLDESIDELNEMIEQREAVATDLVP